MFFKNIYRLGDKAEDTVRVRLSHFPILYAFLGGVGAILFWRGIWHTVDYLMEHWFANLDLIAPESISHLLWWDGPLSIALGTAILLISGLFVSNFIGNEIIISGLKKEKKLTEKTEEDIKMDLEETLFMKKEIEKVDKRLASIESVLKNRN